MPCHRPQVVRGPLGNERISFGLGLDCLILSGATPLSASATSSKIEDFFDASIKATVVGGKTFAASAAQSRSCSALVPASISTPMSKFSCWTGYSRDWKEKPRASIPYVRRMTRTSPPPPKRYPPHAGAVEEERNRRVRRRRSRGSADARHAVARRAICPRSARAHRHGAEHRETHPHLR